MSKEPLMTNQEAADELKQLLEVYSIVPRGCAKSHVPRILKLVALQKAIDLLEKTPDEGADTK